MARFNRRVTNRLARHIAWWAPGFAIVTHVGRRSGHVYRTPVNVFRDGGRFVFALTYGRESDWVSNVLAAERCQLETRRRTIELRNPHLFVDPRRQAVPRPVRLILGAAHVDEFLAMTPSATTSRSTSSSEL
jgi:deazaflavin-dependent oxidoreductase (nitroreductase family)